MIDGSISMIGEVLLLSILVLFPMVSVCFVGQTFNQMTRTPP